MIELVNVTKYYHTEFGRHFIIRNVSLVLPDKMNVGIIGPNGAGKSTLLRLISGADIPNEGKVVRTGRISWPLGLTPGVQPNLTGAENTRFAGRIYGMTSTQIKRTIERVREISRLGKFFDVNVSTYSSGMRQRLSFAISMAMEFDYYLFDEINAGGDLAFKAQAKAMMADRLARSNFILISHNLSEIRRLCQSAILLARGELRYFTDVEEAIVVYQSEYGTHPNATNGVSLLLDDDEDGDKDMLSRPRPGVARRASKPGLPANLQKSGGARAPRGAQALAPGSPARPAPQAAGFGPEATKAERLRIREERLARQQALQAKRAVGQPENLPNQPAPGVGAGPSAIGRVANRAAGSTPTDRSTR
jgi:capsular polysaccharide transport system ATP-binding protein